MLSKLVQASVAANVLFGHDTVSSLKTYEIKSKKPLDKGKSFVIIGDYAN